MDTRLTRRTWVTADAAGCEMTVTVLVSRYSNGEISRVYTAKGQVIEAGTLDELRQIVADNKPRAADSGRVGGEKQ